MLRSSIDGEKVAARTQSCCRLLFWTPARLKGIATLGSAMYKFYAYLRRTPRTLPWMLTLAAGAEMGDISVLEGCRRAMLPSGEKRWRGASAPSVRLAM